MIVKVFIFPFTCSPPTLSDPIYCAFLFFASCCSDAIFQSQDGQDPCLSEYLNKFLNGSPNDFLVNLEVMPASFRFQNICYPHAFPFDDPPRFYRMTSLLSKISPCFPRRKRRVLARRYAQGSRRAALRKFVPSPARLDCGMFAFLNGEIALVLFHSPAPSPGKTTSIAFFPIFLTSPRGQAAGRRAGQGRIRAKGEAREAGRSSGRRQASRRR